MSIFKLSSVAFRNLGLVLSGTSLTALGCGESSLLREDCLRHDPPNTPEADRDPLAIELCNTAYVDSCEELATQLRPLPWCGYASAILGIDGGECQRVSVETPPRRYSTMVCQNLCSLELRVRVKEWGSYTWETCTIHALFKDGLAEDSWSTCGLQVDRGIETFIVRDEETGEQICEDPVNQTLIGF